MAGRDVSFLDRKIADSKITEAQRKAYLWLGEQLFGWRYLPAIGALTDREGRTASESAALRWMRSPSGMFEVIDAMNSQEFFLIYEQYRRIQEGELEGVEHRAAFRKTFHPFRGMSYAVSFVDAVLDAACLMLRHKNGEAPEL